MLRMSLLSAGVFAALWFSTLSSRSTTMSDARNDEQEIMRMEREFGEALTRRDPKPIEGFLADDFSAIVASGEVFDRRQTLAAVTSTDYEIVSLHNEDIRVRVYGDAAVAAARGVVRGRYKGHDASGQFLYTRVWIRSKAHWQAVAAQSTNLPTWSAEIPAR